MRKKIWDFWAERYTSLWVQKYSLAPTRERVKSIISKINSLAPMKLLDIGCGVGELISLLKELDNIEICGLDFSPKMIEESTKRNNKVNHLLMDAEDISQIEEKFDLITCTHSFPYYKSQKKFIKDIHGLLYDDGRVILAFASGNSLMDKIILLFVKITTGPAAYPSDLKFREIIEKYFEIESREIIKKKPYMPTIAVYTLRKA